MRSHVDIEKKEGFSWKRRDLPGTAYGIVISTHSQRIPITTQELQHGPGPCAYNTRDGCDRTFSSIYDAKRHAEEHNYKPQWVYQYPRRQSHMQGRRQTQVGALPKI